MTELGLDRREGDRDRNEGISTQIGECPFSTLRRTIFSPDDAERAGKEDRGSIPLINSSSETVSRRVETIAKSFKDQLRVNASEVLMPIFKSNNGGITQEFDRPSDAAALCSRADRASVRQLLQLTTRPGGPFAFKSTERLANRIRRSLQCTEESLMPWETLGRNEATTSMKKTVPFRSDSGYSSYAATVNEHDGYSDDSEADAIIGQSTQTTIDADLDTKGVSSGNLGQLTVEDADALHPVHNSASVKRSPIQSAHSVLNYAEIYRLRYNTLHTAEEGCDSTVTSNDSLSTLGQPSSDRIEEDVHRNHPYRHHRLFNSHPHLHNLYPPNIPAFVSQPIQSYPTYYASEDHEQTLSIGPSYVPVLDSTVVVTCESCLRRFVMTADRPDVLDRHQRLFCRTARQQKLQKWWRKLETRLGFGVVVSHAEEILLSGSGKTRHAERNLY
ncbi:hypothetical protein BGZ67_003846 [Mortierella alpina]|nr:hypothetical protein BGZ67_003846 [Mortierella alpina]